MTRDQAFIERAAVLLHESGFSVTMADGYYLHLNDHDRSLMIYPGAKTNDVLPDLSELKDFGLAEGMEHAHVVDCRWEDLFCKTINRLSRGMPLNFVVVDNGDKVLLPVHVEPGNIHL